MTEYHKINSIFKRDGGGRFITGDWAAPEFAYLANNEWVFTEKVDGTNIRVYWDGSRVWFGGRTDNAQMPTFLMRKLEETFPPEKMREKFPDLTAPIVLYGEGFGAKIQKGGGNYIPDGQGFCLFDVHVGMFLKRENVADVAQFFGVPVAPEIGRGTLYDGIAKVRAGFESTWGKFAAEGIVCRPPVELRNRRGDRVITKIKIRDFK